MAKGNDSANDPAQAQDQTVTDETQQVVAATAKLTGSTTVCVNCGHSKLEHQQLAITMYGCSNCSCQVSQTEATDIDPFSRLVPNTP